jgi:hypothetical protein
MPIIVPEENAVGLAGLTDMKFRAPDYNVAWHPQHPPRSVGQCAAQFHCSI